MHGLNTLNFAVSGSLVVGAIAGVPVLPGYRCDDGDRLAAHCVSCLCVHKFGPVPPRFGSGDGQRVAPCGARYHVIETREMAPHRLLELVGDGPVEVTAGVAFAIGRPQGLRCWHG
jgi:hypothetical protein